MIGNGKDMKSMCSTIDSINYEECYTEIVLSVFGLAAGSVFSPFKELSLRAKGRLMIKLDSPHRVSSYSYVCVNVITL